LGVDRFNWSQVLDFPASWTVEIWHDAEFDSSGTVLYDELGRPYADASGTPYHVPGMAKVIYDASGTPYHFGQSDPGRNGTPVYREPAATPRYDPIQQSGADRSYVFGVKIRTSPGGPLVTRHFRINHAFADL